MSGTTGLALHLCVRRVSAILVTSLLLVAHVAAQDELPSDVQDPNQALSATPASENQSTDQPDEINTDHSPAASSTEAPTVAPAAATLVAQMVGDLDVTPEVVATAALAAPAASPTEVPIEPDQDDFAKLKLDMAISSFRLNPDNRTRAMVIDAYQGLVIRECYSQVYRNLTLTPPGSVLCQSFVAKLLQFEPQNPLAVCAREGFDSSGCRMAYRGQTFRSFSERSDDTELDQVLDLKRNEAELQQLQNIISSARTDYEVHQDAESRQKLISQMEHGIEKACRSITEAPIEENDDGRAWLKKYPELEQIVSGQESSTTQSNSLANMIEPTSPPEAVVSPTPTERPYAGFLKEISPESPATKVETTRYRNASPYCYGFVSQLLEFEPMHPRATCLRDGPYSPSCLLAVKRQRETPPTARPGATAAPKRRSTGGGGLGTF